MSLVQVLFVCKSSPDLSTERQITEFEVMQLNCCAMNIAGFFLAMPTGYVGLFEAEEDIVIARIEQIVKARKFREIKVLREIHPKSPTCQDWHVSDSQPLNIRPEEFLSPEYLAEFIGSALKPLSKRLRQ